MKIQLLIQPDWGEWNLLFHDERERVDIQAVESTFS